MAKALLGYRPANDHRMVLETIELRRRIRDLEHLVDQLQRDNDKLREEMRRAETVGAGAPTIVG